MKSIHLFLAIPAVLLLGACDPSKPAPAAPAAAQTIDVVQVASQPLDTSVRLPGELQPYENVAIYAKVSGFVESIPVDRGTRVKAGQSLARLVAPELVSQRAEAQSKAEGVQSQLLATQAKLSSDDGTYQKLLAASRTPGAVAGNDLLVAQKAMESDQAQVRAAQSNAEAARQALRAVAEMEKYLSITAPFSGVVTERNVHPGALVGPSQTTPLLRVETLDRLRLVVPVPETYVAAVSEGTTVSFSVPAYPNEKFSGKIARISHAVDAKTRTMPVELDVPNPSGKLAPGTFTEVVWPVHRAQAGLFVPAASVATNLERTFVVRIRNGKTEWVDVKTGAASGRLVEVFGELKAGDQVAMRGTDELSPGIPVSSHQVPAQ